MLKEKFAEISTPKAAKNSSKMKPICGHGPNTCYGPYVENDACNFGQHLKDSNYMHVGKSGWIKSSSNSSLASEA